MSCVLSVCALCMWATPIHRPTSPRKPRYVSHQARTCRCHAQSQRPQGMWLVADATSSAAADHCAFAFVLQVSPNRYQHLQGERPWPIPSTAHALMLDLAATCYEASLAPSTAQVAVLSFVCVLSLFCCVSYAVDPRSLSLWQVCYGLGSVPSTTCLRIGCEWTHVVTQRHISTGRTYQHRWTSQHRCALQYSDLVQ